MRKHEIDEMAINIHNINVGKEGDDVSSFNKDDRSIINSEKAIQKIKKIWRSSVVNVDLYTLDVNLAPDEALDIAIFGNTLHDANSNSKKERAHTLDDLGDIQINPDNITVILTNNSGAERYPLTGWIIAHRLFHTFQSDRFGKYHQANMSRVKGETTPYQIVNVIFEQLSGVLFDLENYRVTNGHYEDHIKRVDLAALIGTTKACRDFKLSNSSELLPECFAQYMLKGKVTLRPLPNGPFHTADTWGASPTLKAYEPLPDTDLRYCNSVVRSFEDFLNRYFAKLIESAKGRAVAL